MFKSIDVEQSLRPLSLSFPRIPLYMKAKKNVNAGRKSEVAAKIIAANIFDHGDITKEDKHEKTSKCIHDFKGLDAAAEEARRVVELLKQGFDEASAQHELIKAAIMRSGAADKKDARVSTEIWFKEGEAGLSTSAMDKSVMTDVDEDLTNRLVNLEECLLVCYAKYQSEKEKNELLTKSYADLQGKLTLLTARNEDLRNKLKANSSSVVKKLPFIPTSVSSFCVLTALMRKLPRHLDRPHPSQRKPVCSSDINLKDYIESDDRTRKYSNNFLYLPERTVWCNQDEEHALAFGPMYFCDKNNRSSKGSTFENLYDRIFHLFFLKDKAIYYVGMYKALNIRSITPNGVPIRDFNGFVSPHGLAEATLSHAGDPLVRKERLHTLSRMYQDGMLNAECMALHNLGFDYVLYERMSERFEIDRIIDRPRLVTSRREVFYPEISGDELLPSNVKRLKLT